MISRGGFELNEIWASQSHLVEADNRIRNLERAWKASGNEEDLAAWHREMVRAGRGKESIPHVIRPHMDRFSAAHRRAQDRVGGDGKEWHKAWKEAGEHKRKLHKIADEHGELIADHVHRHENETPRQFQDRLVDLQRDVGTYRPSAGAVNFENHAWSRPKEKGVDPTLHRRRAEATARAWERGVPGGRAEVGGRHSYDPPDEEGNQKQHVKGSYVFFHQGEQGS